MLIARLAAVGAIAIGRAGSPVAAGDGQSARRCCSERLGEGDMTEDTLHAIAALLDEAAQKIERL